MGMDKRMICKTCKKMILEPGVTYGINPNAVCKCPTSSQDNPQNDTQDQTQADELDTILNLYRRDIERQYGGRTVGKTLNEAEAKARIDQYAQQRALEARIDEQTHTQADIDGNVEFWPDGVTVMSQLERLEQLQAKRLNLTKDSER